VESDQRNDLSMAGGQKEFEDRDSPFSRRDFLPGLLLGTAALATGFRVLAGQVLRQNIEVEIA
jgi:hypothetical protein